MDLPAENLEELVDGESEGSLPLQLIILDEYRRIREKKDQVKEEVQRKNSKTSITIQQKNLTSDKSFKIEDSMHDMPIEGSGKLKDVVLISDSKDYRIKLESDSDYILNDDYDYLDSITYEVEDLSVYTKNGSHFLSMGEVSFKDRLFIKIYPHEEVTFSLIRADIVLD